VSAADRADMCAATRHLLELGHTRIAFLGGGRRPYLAMQRLAGFLDALSRAGRVPDEGLMLEGDSSRESGYVAAHQLFSRAGGLERRLPTAILCANDPMALGVLQAAHEFHISVPQDLSVVGCDDTLAAQASPPLTTIHRPFEAMGATALRALVGEAALAGQAAHETARANGAGKISRQTDLATQLIVRASTAPPR
jgi:LacI family transcriptional regulator